MSQGQGLLVDTGFFIALYDERDSYHPEAQEKQKLLDVYAIILPWPVLYETVNTRFSRRRGIMAQFDAIITSDNTELLDDSPYRVEAYQAVTRKAHRPLSLVDAVLRTIIEDTNVAVTAMLTFNKRDFNDVCWQHSVELP